MSTTLNTSSLQYVRKLIIRNFKLSTFTRLIKLVMFFFFAQYNLIFLVPILVCYFVQVIVCYRDRASSMFDNS